MKNIVLLILFFLVIFASCTHQPSQEAVKPNTIDSAMLRKVQQKDSSIIAYVRSINMIQSSIDTLMRQAKILKKHGEPITNDTISIVSELRAIGQQMLKNQRALVNLEMKLKKSNESNDELVDLGENLSKELNEKDSEINAMQQTLIKTKASLNTLTTQFNDSINVIMQERAQIGLMTTADNKVYYIIGTEKELKDKGIITDAGGVVGLGKVPVLSQDMSSSGFFSADMTNLHEIPLGGIFVKLVTVHTGKAFRISHASTDKLIITDPSDFWSKSKYMVVIVTK